ncbi:MAG: porin family protein [Oceanihabitans sp.]
MKRIFTSLALLLCIVVHAQETEAEKPEKGIKFGVKGGLSLPSLSDNSDNIYAKDFKSYASYETGIFVDYGLNEKLSLQLELNYTVKGGERNGLQPVPADQMPPGLAPPGTVFYADFDNRTALEYLEVPILAKMTFGSNWRFFGNVGPYFGFLIGAEQETSGSSRLYADEDGDMPIPLPPEYGGNNPLPFDAKTDIKDNIKNFNFGAIAGVGVSKSISKHSEFLFEVRGTYGFIKIQENSDFGESRIGSVLFSLGYAYKL